MNEKKPIETTKGLIDEMNPKSGWNIPFSSASAASEEIILDDGRTAQIQIIIECDEDEFISVK